MTALSAFQINYDVTQRSKAPAVIGVFVFLLDAVFSNDKGAAFKILNIYSQLGTHCRSLFYCARGAPASSRPKIKIISALKEMLSATLH